MASSVSISILLIKSDPDIDNSSFSMRCVVIPTYLVVVLCSEIVHSRTDNRFEAFEASRGRFVAIGGMPIWITDVGTFVVGVEIRCDCRKGVSELAVFEGKSGHVEGIDVFPWARIGECLRRKQTPPYHVWWSGH